MGMSVAQFRLHDRFINKFVGKQPNWGPLGYITYKRTYARSIDDSSDRHRKLAKKHKLKTSEEFWLTVARVVEGHGIRVKPSALHRRCFA